MIDADLFDDALAELDAACELAQHKVSRLAVIHHRLPDNAARPVVAAALTDLDEDPSQAVNRSRALAMGSEGARRQTTGW